MEGSEWVEELQVQNRLLRDQVEILVTTIDELTARVQVLEFSMEEQRQEINYVSSKCNL